MSSLTGTCDTCGRELEVDEKMAGDDICLSCWLEHGIFEEEQPELKADK